MTHPFVSIIIVTYNSAPYLKTCLDSVKKINYPHFELILIDNNSQDKTVLEAKKILDQPGFPVTIKVNKKNKGYAAANNQGSLLAKGSYLFILNPDTMVRSNLLNELLSAAEKNRDPLQQVAAWQPTVYLLNEPRKINLTGKVTHYLGFDWIKDYRQAKVPPAQEITSFSGSGVLLKKDIFTKLGGFDEFYFMYYEDSDLSWRLRLAGYNIMYVPQGEIFHDYKYIPQPTAQTMHQKLFYAERNRLITILKNYSRRSLLLLGPMFVLIEVAMVVFAILNGWGKEKIATYKSILANWHTIRNSRRLAQSFRSISDRKITEPFVSIVDFQEFRHPVVVWILNPLMTLYWLIVSRWL